MARRSKMSVLKRQRERKKAEKAAMKREERSLREPSERGPANPVATADDLAGYGFPVDDEEEGATDEDETDQ